MLSAYSNGGALPDGYIASIAQVLTQFPREVVVHACSPVHGVPKDCKQYRPNAGQVYEWCEIHTEPLWERAKLEVPALPPPETPKVDLEERRKQVAQVLGRLAERKTIKKSWYDGRSEAEAQKFLDEQEDRGVANKTHHGAP